MLVAVLSARTTTVSDTTAGLRVTATGEADPSHCTVAGKNPGAETCTIPRSGEDEMVKEPASSEIVL